MNKPRVVIPIGDPAGIGPEIALKAVCSPEVREKADCVLVGSEDVLQEAARFSGLSVPFRLIESPGDYREGDEVVHLIPMDNVDLSRFRMGEVSPLCGRAAYEYIEKSVSLAMAGEVDAVCTTAINKESLKAGSPLYRAHRNVRRLNGDPDPLTMFEVRGMRIFFLTRHVSLREACGLVRKERIVTYVLRCREALERLGVKEGVMAVAGLNPHSGEHGLFGDEEVCEVIPAVEELKARGVPVEGPVGADSVFHQALMGKYSAVLSLYHDQGHIAAKTLDFERTVSVTCSMPILRTSVDHGTAFDIAGKGIASEVSMKEAIFVAAKYAALR